MLSYSSAYVAVSKVLSLFRGSLQTGKHLGENVKLLGTTSPWATQNFLTYIRLGGRGKLS